MADSGRPEAAATVWKIELSSRRWAASAGRPQVVPGIVHRAVVSARGPAWITGGGQ